MRKIRQKSLPLNKKSTVQSGSSFLLFCRALNEYCDEIGVDSHDFCAARILHDAAFNTMTQRDAANDAKAQQINAAGHQIPQMFAGILEISQQEGFLNTRNRLSEMSLDQLMIVISKNSHNR